MDNVIELRPQQLESIAKEFALKYDTESPESAALWIRDKIEDSEIDRMSVLIKKELINLGYVFPGDK